MSLETDHHLVGHHPPLRCRWSVVGGADPAPYARNVRAAIPLRLRRQSWCAGRSRGGNGRTGEGLLAAAIAEATNHGLAMADPALSSATKVPGMGLSEREEASGVSMDSRCQQRRWAIAQLVAW